MPSAVEATETLRRLVADGTGGDSDDAVEARVSALDRIDRRLDDEELAADAAVAAARAGRTRHRPVGLLVESDTRWRCVNPSSWR